MVEHTIRVYDEDVPLIDVHASRGKISRAEPVEALYSVGRVHHVGTFPELESQMTTYVPGEPSPDRMDALVWAITELAKLGEEKKLPAPRPAVGGQRAYATSSARVPRMPSSKQVRR